MCHYFRDCNGLPILCAGEEVYDLGEEEQPSATEPEHSTTRSGLHERCEKAEEAARSRQGFR